MLSVPSQTESIYPSKFRVAMPSVRVNVARKGESQMDSAFQSFKTYQKILLVLVPRLRGFTYVQMSTPNFRRHERGEDLKADVCILVKGL